ncbi:5-formyltetrahydrofolate cyclo-ligase [Sporosarcina limicola]|uniref:5-formyltetrahydrofolate cyclo-ligase n=1 Tax=Sporosarcina limicola TaxID=34101 RepID=A0A927MFZ6_9BACL|nr:5-formyltetrahydrofolate cyclo-ligase [Sporosarcina limicola]MBE1553750.1 5-formyltetrahydrofolate cyclo-ligase [Sporosarcina limicola]
MEKKQFRNQLLAVMNKMNRTEHEKQSFDITNRFLASTEFREANTIGITISRFPEVDTRLLIEAAWKAGKRIAVPKCNAVTRDMDFRVITSYDSLETVYMDLLEPIVDETEAINKDNISLQIVPGVVFSSAGFRIGFGGGYYDRYMADFKGGALSLAFECQTNYIVPVENHDIPVEKIFTEQQVILCRVSECGK